MQRTYKNQQDFWMKESCERQ